jgi:hypothetical protein
MNFGTTTETAMSKSLSLEAIEALRRLNDTDGGQVPPVLSPDLAQELVGAGLATGTGADRVHITCDGRKYLSGDCD